MCIIRKTMENDFWNHRSNIHSKVEYKDGIQYVYACNCSECLIPSIDKIKLAKPKAHLINYVPVNFDCDFSNNDFINPKSDISFEKSKKWATKIKQRKQRKNDQKLLRRLIAQNKHKAN